jgi:hypothetical protein
MTIPNTLIHDRENRENETNELKMCLRRFWVRTVVCYGNYFMR